MKYLLKVPGIHMKSAMKYPKERMKYLLKAPGIHMKCAMKYSRGRNEISIESGRYPYEKHNEIS